MFTDKVNEIEAVNTLHTNFNRMIETQLEATIDKKQKLASVQNARWASYNNNSRTQGDSVH